MEKIIAFSIVPMITTFLSIFLIGKFTLWRKEEKNINNFIVKINRKFSVFGGCFLFIVACIDLTLNICTFFYQESDNYIGAVLSNIFILFFIILFVGSLNTKMVVNKNEFTYTNFFRIKYKYNFSSIQRVEKVMIRGNQILRLYIGDKTIIFSKVFVDNFELLEKKITQCHIDIDCLFW